MLYIIYKHKKTVQFKILFRYYVWYHTAVATTGSMERKKFHIYWGSPPLIGASHLQLPVTAYNTLQDNELHAIYPYYIHVLVYPAMWRQRARRHLQLQVWPNRGVSQAAYITHFIGVQVIYSYLLLHRIHCETMNYMQYIRILRHCQLTFPILWNSNGVYM